jgi:hypothetical protein
MEPIGTIKTPASWKDTEDMHRDILVFQEQEIDWSNEGSGNNILRGGHGSKRQME